jgi:hypothetical protein
LVSEVDNHNWVASSISSIQDIARMIVKIRSASDGQGDDSIPSTSTMEPSLRKSELRPRFKVLDLCLVGMNSNESLCQ